MVLQFVTDKPITDLLHLSLCKIFVNCESHMLMPAMHIAYMTIIHHKTQSTPSPTPIRVRIFFQVAITILAI